MKPQEQKRKMCGFSLYQADKEMLKTVAKHTGLNESQVVRELIYKAFVDDECKKQIMYQYMRKNENKASLRIMSNASTKKDEPTDHTEGSTAVSLNNQEYSNDQMAYFQHISQKAKEKWFPDD